MGSGNPLNDMNRRRMESLGRKSQVHISPLPLSQEQGNKQYKQWNTMIYRIILQKETILGFNEEEWIDNNDLRRKFF